MSDKHRVEVLERAIVKALRAAKKGNLPKVISELVRVEVDETQYPEPIPLTEKITK